MKISILYSTFVWTLPLEDTALKQHVYNLYQNLFSEYDIEVYPKSNQRLGLIIDGLRHMRAVLKTDMSVLCPDYPVVSGAFVSILKPNHPFIIHLWKIPSLISDHFIKGIKDIMLWRVIKCSKAVIVPSLYMKTSLESQEPSIRVFYSPVSVDSSFWKSDSREINECLARYGLKRNKYVITVGGSDRDELYSARVSHLLDLHYVRVSYDKKIISRVRAILEKNGAESKLITLCNINHRDLRSLYAGSTLLSLPTLTDTNPAGLSAMVEGLACSTLVAVPQKLGSGYIKDGINGFILDQDPVRFVQHILSLQATWPSIRENARLFAVSELDNNVIVRNLKANLKI